MKISETKISGCYLITPSIFKDDRGSFVKTFHQDIFLSNKLITDFAEEFYSVSHQNVIRGLHFQSPPKDHIKMVYCVQGEVIDVVVDLRLGSPTYSKFELFNLSGENGQQVYLLPGLAHGFYAMSKTAIMMYKTSSVYSPENDTGILWNSVGIPWPSKTPIISKRDQSFLPLVDFNSPFVYEY